MIWGESYFQSHLIILFIILKRNQKVRTFEFKFTIIQSKKIQTVVLTPHFVIFYLFGLINTNDVSA